jgi:hypothetical protein
VNEKVPFLKFFQTILVSASFSILLSANAQTISAVPESVERYARAINAAMNGSKSVSLEKAFEEGISVAEDLEKNLLERLDESTYQKVQHMMLGFWVNRIEVIVVNPDPGFFLHWARKNGTKADQAFFKALQETYPEPKSWVPVYKTQVTDYSACTLFNGKTLTETYKRWIAFQDAYPGRYPVGARKEIARIEESLESDCACGGEDEYRRELQNFIKTNPSSRFASGMAARLEEIEKHTSKIRFHCMPH